MLGLNIAKSHGLGQNVAIVEAISGCYSFRKKNLNNIGLSGQAVYL